MNSNDLKLVAICGFGHNPPKKNIEIAYNLGTQLSNLGFGICSGNLVGTFLAAFKGAKSVNGQTKAIITPEQKLECKYCDEIIIVSDNYSKYAMISKVCDFAIVIGGGKGTENLIKLFIKQNKKTLLYLSTGGIVDRLKQTNNLIFISDLNECVQYIKNNLISLPTFDISTQ